jgi:hypothetical protein
MQTYIEGSQVPSRCGNSPADNPTPHFWCSRRITPMCCGASRRASCCRRRMPSSASIASLVALADSPVPVARAYALCEDPAVIGTAFYVMDYVEGRIFWDAALPEVAAGGRRAIYEEMTRVIAALHSVDYAPANLGDYGKPGRYIERQVARWTQQYRASETEPIDADGAAHRVAAATHSPDDEKPASSTAIFGSTTRSFIRASREFWRCSTGNCRPWAIRSWILAYLCMRYHLVGELFRGLGGLDPRRCRFRRGRVRRRLLPAARPRPGISTRLDLLSGVQHVSPGGDSAGRARTSHAGQCIERDRAGGGPQSAAAGRAGLEAGAAIVRRLIDSKDTSMDFSHSDKVRRLQVELSISWTRMSIRLSRCFMRSWRTTAAAAIPGRSPRSWRS